MNTNYYTLRAHNSGLLCLTKVPNDQSRRIRTCILGIYNCCGGKNLLPKMTWFTSTFSCWHSFQDIIKGCIVNQFINSHHDLTLPRIWFSCIANSNIYVISRRNRYHRTFFYKLLLKNLTIYKFSDFWLVKYGWGTTEVLVVTVEEVCCGI